MSIVVLIGACDSDSGGRSHPQDASQSDVHGLDAGDTDAEANRDTDATDLGDAARDASDAADADTGAPSPKPCETVDAHQFLLQNGVIAWHPSQKRLAVSAGAGVAVYGADQREVIWSDFPFERGEVVSLAWAPDGSKLAAATYFATAVWDADSGQLVGVTEDVTQPVSFSLDGATLLAGVPTSYALVDPQTVQVRETMPEVRQHSKRAFLWVEGSSLALLGDSGGYALVDTTSWQVIEAFDQFEYFDSSVAINSDRGLLAIRSETDLVLYDTAARQERFELTSAQVTGGLADAEGVAISPDGALLAVSNGAEQVLLLDTTTAEVQSELDGPSSSVEALSFSPDGTLLKGDYFIDDAWLWNLDDPSLSAELEDMARPAFFSPDSSLLADRRVRFMELSTAETFEFGGTLSGRPIAASWSPDGQSLAVADSNHFVSVWSPDGELQHRFEASTSGLRGLSWAPDGATLVTTDGEKRLHIWETSSWSETTVDTDLPLQSVAFSPDGKWLAAGSGVSELGDDDEAVIIWDTSDWSEQTRLDGLDYGPTGIGWSSDSQWLSATPRSVVIWQASDWSVAKQEAFANWIHQSTFSPDGASMVVSELEGQLMVYDTATWQRETIHPGGQYDRGERATWVDWHPEQALIAGSESNMVNLFGHDGQQWNLLQQLALSQGTLTDLRWSPDGKRLAAASLDSLIIYGCQGVPDH